ncbi:hypothetical protein GCM10025857_21440 [Alicyclobacillus contaminans]|uniref:hypothetical protein n=1 Tax=Alicyclobacillus contaminans TaxID=392016 RepID=UPI00042840C9|nr:hypothetical protein [Alicyclobacillus contaminans]GMA50787.1 hypothetical protein GCM10025857_21440 [Alicyclobacillus contaminans]
MKKRRSTVYVRPGKDVTLYVPAETPPEVIEYLNRLKDEGNFSQGVIDILTEYIQSKGRTAAATQAAVDIDPADGQSVHPREPSVIEFPTETSRQEPPASTSSASDPAGGAEVDRADAPTEEPSAHVPEPHTERRKLSLAQIFRQAQRNAGRLTDG